VGLTPTTHTMNRILEEFERLMLYGYSPDEIYESWTTPGDYRDGVIALGDPEDFYRLLNDLEHFFEENDLSYKDGGADWEAGSL
jgi:hypothetical protein